MEKQEKRANRKMVAMNLMAALAMSLYMPLRHKMGRHHFGACPLLGWCLMFGWSAVTNSPSLLWLGVINLFVWVSELFSASVRRRRGIVEHTNYSGFPFATYWLFRDEGVCKQVGEPLVALGVGTLIYFFSPEPDAATYFWYGAAGMFVYQWTIGEQTRNFVEQVNNTRIENEYVMGKLKRSM